MIVFARVFAGRTPFDNAQSMGRRPKAFAYIGFLKTIMLGPLYSHLSQLFTPVRGPGPLLPEKRYTLFFGTSFTIQVLHPE
jgi:hypothetical protein